MKFKSQKLVALALLSLVVTACSDARISVPVNAASYRYDLAARSRDSELQRVRLYVTDTEFAVKPSQITPHDYTGKYNGCVEIQAFFDGSEATLFSFINWSSSGGSLIVMLNWSPADDAALRLSNNDGGELEAILSTTDSDGTPRQFSMRGKSPTPDNGEYCLKQANSD